MLPKTSGADHIIVLEHLGHAYIEAGRDFDAACVWQKLWLNAKRRDDPVAVMRAAYNIGEALKFDAPADSYAWYMQAIEAATSLEHPIGYEHFARAVHGVAHAVSSDWFYFTDEPGATGASVVEVALGDGFYFAQPIRRSTAMDGCTLVPAPTDRPLINAARKVSRQLEKAADFASMDDKSRRKLSLDLHLSAIEILVNPPAWFPAEYLPGIAEQAARARQCYAMSAVEAGDRRSATAQLQQAIQHWRMIPELEAGQQHRFASAIALRGTMKFLKGDLEGGEADFAEAIGIHSDDGEITRYQIGLAHCYESLAIHQRSNVRRLGLLFQARKLRLEVGNLYELLWCDRLIADTYDKSHPEKAFQWRVSAWMTLIGWSFELQTFSEGRTHELGARMLAELYRSFQATGLSLRFVNCLLSLNQPRAVYAHIKSRLKGIKPQDPLHEFDIWDYRSVEACCEAGEAMWFIAGFDGFWVSAYHGLAGRWEVQIEDDHETIRRLSAMRADLRASRWRMSDFDLTLRLFGPRRQSGWHMLDLSNFVAKSMITDGHRRIASGEVLTVRTVPCGEAAQLVPWHMVPLRNDFYVNGRYELVLDRCMLMVVCSSADARRPMDATSREEATRGVPICEPRTVATSARRLISDSRRLIRTRHDAIRQLQSADIGLVHLGGHSVPNAKRNEAGIAWHDTSRLMGKDIPARPGRDGPLIFLSGCCTTAIPSDINDDWGGLALMFLSRGYPTVIGTIWAVPENENTWEFERQFIDEVEQCSFSDPASELRSLQLRLLSEAHSDGNDRTSTQGGHWVPYISIVDRLH
ncbi:CHAT domain-containing protein [Rhodococcus ruber]|uniref:CHAT domain-containing protein n=1 Tax=Rhodococcus TaxID=1827 RepID=UPI00065FEFF4|nr:MULTISPECIES: CHAT domain-containing protein [Rhodococcus]UQB71578.1 CHAT domain-containing protein [Rhodococcus ruber]WML61398.1 CHAT domain-containing protein [Rhodococcus sp. AH-ZY2]